MNQLEQAMFVVEHNQKVSAIWNQLQSARGDSQRYEKLFDLFIRAQDERAAFEAAQNSYEGE